MKTKIEKGDSVIVCYENGSLSGKVEYIAGASGDCWIIIDDTGRPHHVQTFQEICYNGPMPQTNMKF